MTRRRITRGVLWAVIAATTLFIWSWSLKPADVSQSESDMVRRIIVAVCGTEAVGSWLYVYIRKVGHFAEFALLGVEWGIARRWLSDRARWVALAAGPIVGACDELLQHFSVGRSPQVSDVLLDCAGYACGMAAVWVIRRLCARRSRHMDT